MRQQAQETKQFIDKQEAEERKLLKIIADADVERVRQKKELDQVHTSKWFLSPSHYVFFFPSCDAFDSRDERV